MANGCPKHQAGGTQATGTAVCICDQPTDVVPVRLADQSRHAETVPLVGGRYDRVRVGAHLPDVILVGPRRLRYEAIKDPDTGERLGGYAPNYPPGEASDA